MEQNLFIMSRSTFEIGASQLRSVTEIAPPQPILCVNKISIGYDFLAVQKLYSVNKDLFCAYHISCAPSIKETVHRQKSKFGSAERMKELFRK